MEALLVPIPYSGLPLRSFQHRLPPLGQAELHCFRSGALTAVWGFQQQPCAESWRWMIPSKPTCSRLLPREGPATGPCKLDSGDGTVQPPLCIWDSGSFSGWATNGTPTARPREASEVVCPCACLLAHGMLTKQLTWPGPAVPCRAQVLGTAASPSQAPPFQMLTLNGSLPHTPCISSGETALCTLHRLFPLPGTYLQHPALPIP